MDEILCCGRNGSAACNEWGQTDYLAHASSWCVWLTPHFRTPWYQPPSSSFQQMHHHSAPLISVLSPSEAPAPDCPSASPCRRFAAHPLACHRPALADSPAEYFITLSAISASNSAFSLCDFALWGINLPDAATQHPNSPAFPVLPH